MKIVSVQFDYPGTKRYKILSEVFEHSVRKNCHTADLIMIRTQPPKLKKKRSSKSFSSNTLKLEIWLNELRKTDEDIIFMDCDMIVLDDLSSVFSYNNFDIGYTKRTNNRIPYNGGVVFVKNTPESIEFIELWNKINKKMYEDYTFHSPWRNKYAGMNQAAFGYILEKEDYDATLKQFPCSIWNACVEDWQRVNSQTKAIHIKGALRRTLIYNRNLTGFMFRRAAILWNNLAAEAGIPNYKKIKQSAPYKMQETDKNKHPHLRRVRGIRRRRRVRI